MTEGTKCPICGEPTVFMQSTEHTTAGTMCVYRCARCSYWESRSFPPQFYVPVVVSGSTTYAVAQGVSAGQLSNRW